ncbi:MAG: DNA polymerase III subunit gamma/tau [Rhodospirillales bacterium]|nr:DNA polymerase III subunit gamma/tau [Rhodospirillales bacterium]
MTDAATAQPYRVLARKYRPSDFGGLIGQDALVRTLTNAIQSGRLAHAFVLTGVRGVGKTTTARIIARALNCVGPDGTGGPTVSPCGVCEHCRAIADDRHVDVLEMDAASRTGVGDIRELIEGVRYRPTSARFKVYIIDEVHMLSTNAFNALLKTLEEPPEHVKFVFATTEIRKIPVTVLSRCQRFDLRRVDAEVLIRHFAAIAEQEKASVEPGALALIARAADGSVRDGLSLLDQAIAHGGGEVSETQVRDMLGLADRIRVFDLFDATMRGDVAGALSQLADQYSVGADPVVVLQDMLELTHWLTRLKIVPEQADDPMVAEAERVRGREMSGQLSMAVLTRAWQMLLKALGDARMAPSPLQAAEMALIRIAYAADLPTPAEAIRALRAQPAAPSPPPSTPGPMPGGGPAPGGYVARQAPNGPGGGPTASLAVEPTVAVAPVADAGPRSYQELVALFIEKRELILAGHLTGDVHLVRFEPERLEFRPTPRAPADLANRVGRLMGEWTGRRWVVSISNEAGAPTLREQETAEEERRRNDAAGHPLVQAVLAAFPDATIEAVRDVARDEPETVESEAMTGEEDL